MIKSRGGICATGETDKPREATHVMYVWAKCMDFVYMLATKFPDSLKKKMKEGKKEERDGGQRE